MPKDNPKTKLLHALTVRRKRRLNADEIDALTQVGEQLTEQVRLLRQAVDEIGEELAWAIRSRVIPHLPPPTLPSITSFPVDPLADDFAEQVNAVSPDMIAAIRQTLPARKQTNLW